MTTGLSDGFSYADKGHGLSFEMLIDTLRASEYPSQVLERHSVSFWTPLSVFSVYVQP